MRNRATIVIGFALIVIGVLAWLASQHVIHIDLGTYWPVALIVMGIFLHMVFVLTGFRETSFLFVGMALLYYGIWFQIVILLGWDTFSWMWPFLLLGPPLGFLDIYLFGGRDKDLLIPVAFMIIPWLFAIGWKMRIDPPMLIIGAVVLAGILFCVFSLMKKNTR